MHVCWWENVLRQVDGWRNWHEGGWNSMLVGKCIWIYGYIGWWVGKMACGWVGGRVEHCIWAGKLDK